nr:GNAT family N-acetyltransferase [uncultured Nocardioides sp.]
MHATDEETLAALHAYGDAWSTAFLEGRLDEEKRKRWLAHSREDDVTFRFARPRTTVAGASRPVATFSSWDQEINVGGASLLPLRMITDVTVAPTHRRRGLLTKLMSEDLAEAAAEGVPVAALTVSEGSIYGRFGFGPATRYRSAEVDVRPGRFRLRHDATAEPGSLQMVEPKDAYPLTREVYAAHLARTRGEVARPAFYEQVYSGSFNWESGGPDRVLTTVLHLDADGRPDGYCHYRVKEGDSHDQHRIDVHDLVALTPTAYLRLWQFLADVDLISVVRARVLHDDPLGPPAIVTSVEPNAAVHCSMPSRPSSVISISAPGETSMAILVGVIDECLFAERHQARALDLVCANAVGRVHQKPEKQCTLLVAQSGLGDEPAELNLLARVLATRIGLACLSHALKPRHPAPKARQPGPAHLSVGCSAQPPCETVPRSPQAP